MLKRLLIALFAVAVLLPITATKADASLIKNAYMTMSDPQNTATNVTHTFYWINQTANIGGITLQYCVAPSGTCSDTGADGSSASLSSINYNSGAESNWTYSWYDAAWESQLKNTSTSMGSPGGEQYIVTIDDMTNPALASCTFTRPGDASSATCFVKITTYTDSTLVTSRDDGVVSATITQGVTVSARVDPTFTFQVEGVAGDGIITRNGTTMTSGITTTVTTIPFGNLTAGTEKFAGHDLTVVSNTDGGYNVTARMTANMTGSAYSFDIDPFTGNGASETSAQSWLLPTGGTAGTDTGWLGIGTDDTDVSGQASDSFFSLGAVNTTLIMTNADPTLGETNEIAYGLEVNSSQPADGYSGTLLFDAIPVY